MVNAKGWVVGVRLPESGLMVRMDKGWELRGFIHPYIAAADFDPRDPSTLYLAGGDGCIRASQGGRRWKKLTGHEVTELRDLAVDRSAPGHIYIAHTAGVQVTRDGGASWTHVNKGRQRPYTESIRVDRTRAGRVVIGGEDGIWLSEDAGANWRPTGVRGFNIMHLAQSPHDANHWLAVTMKGGPFVSHDNAVTWESVNHLRTGRYTGVDRNLYDIAFDPTHPGRIAICGYGLGVAVSEDAGLSWEWRNNGLPRLELWSVAFHPDWPGRLYASVHEEALYVSDDSGRTWRHEGLDGSAVYRLLFVPEGGLA
jgi:photosystem II stability/assembly factor-like uncharacterized protein